MVLLKQNFNVFSFILFTAWCIINLLRIHKNFSRRTKNVPYKEIMVATNVPFEDDDDFNDDDDEDDDDGEYYWETDDSESENYDNEPEGDN